MYLTNISKQMIILDVSSVMGLIILILRTAKTSKINLKTHVGNLRFLQKCKRKKIEANIFV